MQDWILFAICMAALAVSVLVVAILFPPSSRRGSYPPAMDLEMAVEVEVQTTTVTTSSPPDQGLVAPSTASSSPPSYPVASSTASSPISDDATTLVDGRDKPTNGSFALMSESAWLRPPPTASSRPSMMPPTGGRSVFETYRDGANASASVQERF